MRPWLLLTAFNLSFEETVEWLAPRRTLTGRLLRYSPAARVPVLIDGELTVWDSLAICEYVSETYLDGGGWPRRTAQRARARAAVCEMHAGFAALRGALPMNIRARRRLPLSAAVLADVRRIDAIWARAEGEWLFGDFSIADCFFAPVAMRFLTYEGIALSAAAEEYQQRLRACAAVRQWTRQALLETAVVEEDEAGEDVGGDVVQ